MSYYADHSVAAFYMKTIAKKSKSTRQKYNSMVLDLQRSFKDLKLGLWIHWTETWLYLVCLRFYITKSGVVIIKPQAMRSISWLHDSGKRVYHNLWTQLTIFSSLKYNVCQIIIVWTPARWPITQNWQKPWICCSAPQLHNYTFTKVLSN